MCIIVSKEKGVNLPSKDILKQCFRHNDDGAGLMFVNKGKVNIVKGFMTFERFYDYLMKLDRIHNLKEKALVMHFRISTGGNVDGGNCHPYPISANEKDLRKEYITCNLGMAHNGIISTYNYKTGKLNDTQQFILRCVSTIYAMDREFYKNGKVMEMLEDVAGSKLCFLDNEENIYYVGNFVEEDGIYYSNTSYIPYVYPTTYSYGSYGRYGDWDYYDDYYGIGNYDYNEIKNKTNHTKSKEVDVKEEASNPLSEQEFNILLNNLIILKKGVRLYDKDDIEFVIDDDNTYGLDTWFNLYFIDWENKDIVMIYEDCVITTDSTDLVA